MSSLRALAPEFLVGLGAVVSLLVPALAAPRSRPGIRRWLGWSCAGLAVAALLLELWLGAAVGTLFSGGVLVDRFALGAKAAILAGLIAALAAADWEVEALPGALPFAFLAALGGMVVASSASLAAGWAGLALAVGASLAALSRRVRGDLPPAAEALARDGAARAAVTAGALLLLLALAAGYLMAVGGAASAAELGARLAGATSVSLPTAMVCLLALGSAAALAVLAPFRYGAGLSALTSPLGVGVASGLGAGAAGLAMLKLGAAVAPSGIGWGPGLLAGASGLAVAAGAFLAARPSLRAAMALLGALQLAWVVAGVSAHDAQGASAAVFLLGAAVVALAGGPVLAGNLEAAGAADLAGLGVREPARAGALAVVVLSLAAVPPLAGFFGQFSVAASLAGENAYWALGLLLLGGLLGAGGAVRVARGALVDPAAEESRPTARTAARRPRGTGRMGTGAVLVAAGLFAYGLFANPIWGLAGQGAAALGLR